MPLFTDLKTVTIPTTGGTYTMANTERVGTYIFNGSGALSSNYSVAADLSNALTAGMPNKVKILYQGIFTLNGNTINFFGTYLNQEQALSGNVEFDCVYNGSTWSVVLIESSSAKIPSNQGVKTTTLTAAGGTITLTPGIDNVWQELIGTATLTSSWSVTAPNTAGYFYVHYSGTLTPNGNHLTIFGIQLTDYQVINGNVFVFAYFDTVNNVWRAQLTAKPQPMNPQTIQVPVSFSASGIGAITFTAPYGLTINGINTCVSYPIAAVDDGTVSLVINATPVATITIPNSSAVGSTVNSGLPTPISFFAPIGASISLVPSKPTKGGEVLFFLTYVNTP